MPKRLASLMLAVALAGMASGAVSLAVPMPVAAGSGPGPAASQSCNVQAYIQQTGGTTFRASGYVYCTIAVTDFQLHVRATVCTFDFFGCKAWGDITGWWDLSPSYQNGTHSYSGPWHNFSEALGHRVRVVVDAYYNGYGYFAGTGVSAEIAN